MLWGYGEGARLCKMNLRTGRVTVLLEDKQGGIRDPQLSYNGKKILFSYRPGGEHPYHLYEIDIDGSNLTQLTDGPDDDIEATYCPDGSIVFCSSRCQRFDMPGFRPNKHYIREMKRFGILPQDLGPTDPIDVHAVDKAYWDSFYFEPETEP